MAADVKAGGSSMDACVAKINENITYIDAYEKEPDIWQNNPNQVKVEEAWQRMSGELGVSVKNAKAKIVNLRRSWQRVDGKEGTPSLSYYDKLKFIGPYIKKRPGQQPARPRPPDQQSTKSTPILPKSPLTRPSRRSRQKRDLAFGEDSPLFVPSVASQPEPECAAFGQSVALCLRHVHPVSTRLSFMACVTQAMRLAATGVPVEGVILES